MGIGVHTGQAYSSWQTQYLVKYKGYKLLKDCEWRPESELKETAPELLAEFTEELKKSNSKS